MTTVSPTAAAASAATAPDAMKKLSGNFSTFLTLLTTQLKNQDPTSPMDSNAFTQQLVMYSQVEQQIDTNSNLKTLISQGTSNAAAVTTGYLGKKVSILNGNAALTNGSASWTYNLDAAAATNQLSITDSKGKLVYAGAGETAAGNHTFAWDGKDNNGNQLADGAYTLNVAATGGAGGAVTSSVASAGTVTQIDMTGSTPKLVIGSMEVNLGDVAAVAN
ncbi:MAG: flagellar hook assembly protein FlgD [Alphaproteobacteria bacterium]|nr:flagellar hook assembly protein FlgD [Alphaproteobacteria bacterium]